MGYLDERAEDERMERAQFHAAAMQAHDDLMHSIGYPGSPKRMWLEGRARIHHPSALGSRDDLWADFVESDPARDYS